MRIAFGFDIFYPETNGVISTTINLANNLIDMGHEVYFFVPDDKSFKDNVIEKGIHIIHVKAFPLIIYNGIKILPMWGWYLQRYFRKYKFDIIHQTSPWLMCQALNHSARRMHIPVVATHHTLIDNPIYIQYALHNKRLALAARKPVWTILFKPFYKLVWITTAPNKETCENIKLHIPEMEVRYISNGIDISRFDEKNNACPIPEEIPQEWLDRKTFLFIGRLGYEKSIDVLLDAYKIVHDKHPDSRLLIIGMGPAERDLKEQRDKLGLGSSVLFTGKIENKVIIGSKLITKVGSFVTASLSENQAITIIESLCSGCPVICPDIFNMTEMVSEKSGWHFKGGDYEAMAEVMCHVFENPEERNRKAIEAKKQMDLYDGRVVARQFVDLYEELLQMKKDGFFVSGGKKKAAHYRKVYEFQDRQAQKRAMLSAAKAQSTV